MRSVLSLYTLDRPQLVAFSDELKTALAADDRSALAALLGLGTQLAERLASAPRAVDWFLRSDDDPEAAPLFASLRRVAKRRALTLAWTSAEPSLEGRLRHYDLIRDEAATAELVDRLLDPARLPWFLRRPGATGGWLSAEKREELASALRDLADALPKELAAFAAAVADIDGDVIAHDML